MKSGILEENGEKLEEMGLGTKLLGTTFKSNRTRKTVSSNRLR